MTNQSRAARIAIVTDIHHGTDFHSKRSASALRLMQDFRAFCADAKPDLVIDLGDRITDSDRETDLRLEADVAEAFRPIAAPQRHICGNHDRDFLTLADNEAIFGSAMGHGTLDVGDWTLVFFAPDTTLHKPDGFRMGESDLLWLHGVVSQATRPLAIFSHAPMSGRDMTGSYYFANNQHISTYGDALPAVHDILARARVPVTWISGHVHWNSFTLVNAIPHFTVQSLIESSTTWPEPAGAFAMLELSDQISLEVFGLDAASFRIPAAQTMRRWAPVVPPIPEFMGGYSYSDV